LNFATRPRTSNDLDHLASTANYHRTQAAEYFTIKAFMAILAGIHAACGYPGETAVSCKIRPLVLTSAPGV
jgi:hypothetical protein